jgi:hypothetical protein
MILASGEIKRHAAPRPSRCVRLHLRTNLPLYRARFDQTPTWRWSVALHPNVHQGLHGEGFIHAMACAGGFTTSKMNLDVDGVDWQIAFPGPKGTARSPKLEMQVKSCVNPDVKGGEYQYRLRVKHYNFIAGAGFQVPRFLAW